MPVTKVGSKWESGDLYFYEEEVGRSVTGDIFKIGTSAVTVGGTSQDIDFGWYASGSKSFVLDAGAGTLTMAGIDVSITGDLTIDTEDINLGDDDDLEFGDSQDVLMRFSTADVSDPCFVIGLDDTSQQMHITDKAAIATDWARSAGTHPELAIHSNTTPITDYLAIGNHDGTTAHIDVVGGTTLSLDIAGTAEVLVTASATSPATSDSNALGTGTLMWSDLFLASGAVINFNNGNVTVTHSAGLLTIGSGGLSVGADGAGFDVTFYGDTSGCDFLWDQNLDTNGGLQLGADTKSVSLYAYGLTTGNYLKWDGANDDLIIAGTAARTLHGADGAGNDVIFYGATASYAVTWDADGDTNGSLLVGADTKGILFSLYGDVTGCGVFWDPSTDTNGTLTIGGSGGSKGNDLIAYGASNGNYLHWDQSADDLLLVGTATQFSVAGTTDSSSTSTGSINTAGGLGVAKKAFFGDDVSMTSLICTDNVGAVNTGVTAVEYGDGRTHTTVLTVSQTDALTTGDNGNLCCGYLLYTLPAGAIIVERAYMSMAITHGDAAAQADTPDVGLGTTLGSAVQATLDADDAACENILTGQTADDCNGTAEVKTVADQELVIESGGDHTVYFNAGAAWSDVTDTTADIAGTVVLVWRFMS